MPLNFRAPLDWRERKSVGLAELSVGPTATGQFIMISVSNNSSLQLYKKRLQYKFAQLSRRKAFLSQSSRHGIEDVVDMSFWFSPDVILDVGANVGQSAIRFRSIFPNARIICFEPVASTFVELKKNTRAMGVELHKLALGSETKNQ